MDSDLVGLFSPTGGKDIRLSYPELRLVPEFENVTAKEFTFVWNYVYMFADVPQDRLRIQKSLFLAFGDTMPINDKEKYKNGNYPEKVRVAIEKLRIYDLSSRLMARAINQRTLNNYFEYINSKNLTELSEDDASKFIKNSADINKELPDLLKAMEHNYGVSDKAFNEFQNEYGSMLDVFQQTLKNK